MATRSVFSVKVDTSQLDALVGRLEEVTPETLGARLVAVTNEQIDSAYELSRKRMLSGINLTEPYVKRKMDVTQATKNRPTAEIVAFGGELTTLSHYGAMMNLVDVKHPERSKGRAAWGIPKGKKQGRPSVEVVRGARKTLKSSKAFVIPTLKDKEGNPLIVKREPNGKLGSALLGPSVYQLFRVAATELEERIGDEYEAAITEAAENELKKVLG